MYGMNYSGGGNRTHGQIERAERIDSFEAGKAAGWGILFSSSMVPLDYEHFMEDDGEIVELSRGQWSTTLELTRTPSGFGGSCAYWLCPRCGKRVRFLYFKNRDFLCQSCAKLNYRCQQRTKDSTNYAHDGLKLAREKLRWEPPFPMAPMDFPHVVPDRPRYMHKRTYYRYLARYRRHQKRYEQESMREMLAILRR